MTPPTVRVDEIAAALGISRAQAAEQLAACGIETFPDRSGRSAVTVTDAYRLADAHRQAKDEIVTAPDESARLAVTAYLSITPRPRPGDFRCPLCHAPTGEPCRSPQGTSAGRPHATRRARATEANRRRLDDAQRAGELAHAEHTDPRPLATTGPTEGTTE